MIASVSEVGREGVCGNGICEVGELLPIDSAGVIGRRCAEDCPLQVIGCLQNDAGDVCSGTLPCHPPQPVLFMLYCLRSFMKKIFGYRPRSPDVAISLVLVPNAKQDIF